MSGGVVPTTLKIEISETETAVSQGSSNSPEREFAGQRTGFQIPLLQIAPEGTPPKYGGAIFLKKKSACGNVPRSSGLVKIWGPFLPKKKAPAATCPELKGFQKDGAIL